MPTISTVYGRLPLHCCALVGATLNCSSPQQQPSTSSIGSVEGTVSGHALVARDGVAVAFPNAAIPHLFVVLGDRSPLCTLLQGAATGTPATLEVASLTSLELEVFDQRSRSVNPGTFPVVTTSQNPPLLASGFFSETDSACALPVNQTATAGSVTVATLEPTVTGTYDLTFGSDHITGSFDVANCSNVDIEGSGATNPPVCVK